MLLMLSLTCTCACSVPAVDQLPSLVISTTSTTCAYTYIYMQGLGNALVLRLAQLGSMLVGIVDRKTDGVICMQLLMTRS